MYLILGVAAMVSAVFLYGWALGLTRSPTSPAWAQSQIFSSVVCLTVVGLAPLGVGFLTVGLTQPMSSQQVIGLVALAVSLPMIWLIFPRLSRRGGAKPNPAPAKPQQKMAA